MLHHRPRISSGWILLAALCAGLVACGGSSSETPPPLEPVPERLRVDPDAAQDATNESANDGSTNDGSTNDGSTSDGSTGAPLPSNTSIQN